MINFLNTAITLTPSVTMTFDFGLAQPATKNSDYPISITSFGSSHGKVSRHFSNVLYTGFAYLGR